MVVISELTTIELLLKNNLYREIVVVIVGWS